MTDKTSSSPPRLGEPVNFWWLLFGLSAAPLFWLGQEIFGYCVSSYVCYGSDHPTHMASHGTLKFVLTGFDTLAIIAGITGGVASLMCWWRVCNQNDNTHNLTTDASQGRTRFLSIWALMSSLWFFGAILFTTITSLSVPPCFQ